MTINNKKWYEYEDQEKKFLDNIDLLPFLKKNTELHNIMKEIGKQYNDFYPEQFPIFTYLDKYDFYEYLTKRYPNIYINIQEQPDKYIITKI